MSAVPASRVVLLTPLGRGAVACLAIDGPQAAAILQRHFDCAAGCAAPLETWPQDRIRYGRWLSATRDAAERGPSEDVILVRRAPCRWELHCHGGAAAAPRIIADLQRSGCVVVPWRDWVAQREASPVRAAALALLAKAPTERTATILLDQYLGAWDEFVAVVRAALAAGDLDAALAKLNETLSFVPLGQHLVQPWRVVLAGPPNVGKSSLLNALAGYRRAIVHDQPGTTRDRLTVDIALEGWPIELTDTAGLRASSDPLEAAGVARADAAISAADAVVFVFDAAARWEPEHTALAARRTDAILVHNKADLLPNGADLAGHTPADRPPGLPTSATIGSGLDRLTEHIVTRLVPRSPPSGAAVPILAVQVEQLQAAVEALRGGTARDP